MDDLISRQAAIDAVQQHREDVLGGYKYDEDVAFVYAAAHNHIIRVIKQLPSAERRGRWIFDIDNKGWSWDKPYMCDQCGEWVEKVFKFCPNCGAKMEEGEK